ncbi:MAG: hypothetical protein HXS50_02990 [Theionarchaea archaeon]|nr:hypothetical protein [Theionarchaea archaeon]
MMRYGSIPVFGATGYVSPWFGIIVQWNGLDYAYQLLQLSELDDTLPWRTFAEGITICGMQMQRVPGMAHEEYLGMYPDAYSALKGDEQYFFDINPRFISLCAFGLMGEDQTTQTEILNVSGHLVHISALGKVGNSSYGDNALTFDTTYAEGEISYANVAGVSRPESISINGNQLPEAVDLSVVDSGWLYTSEGNLILKFEHALRDLIRVSGVIPQTSRRFSTEPNWEFNGEDSEGWTNTNMLEFLYVDDGVLSTGSTGADPFMVGPSIRIDGRQDAIVQIRMKTSKGGAGQVFWVTKESPHYSESKSVSFQVAGDGTFHVYNVSIGQNPLWNGTIRQVRIDPVDVGEVDIEIDYIRIPESVTSIPLVLLALLFCRLVGWDACRQREA